MKGRADIRKPVLRGTELDNATNAGILRGEVQQSIIGADEARARGGLDRDRKARSADARIDHRDEDRAPGKKSPALRESQRSRCHGLSRDAMRDVDDARGGRDSGDDALY